MPLRDFDLKLLGCLSVYLSDFFSTKSHGWTLPSVKISAPNSPWKGRYRPKTSGGGTNVGTNEFQSVGTNSNPSKITLIQAIMAVSLFKYVELGDIYAQLKFHKDRLSINGDMLMVPISGTNVGTKNFEPMFKLSKRCQMSNYQTLGLW
ncbi:MAG: hypothetical protein MJE68_01500, partial [Proteobacteria bacterium]|nr:hypothetical protein [Pseudomonadota bacterium]